MDSSQPGGGSGHPEIPGADGSDFYAPAPEAERSDRFTPKEQERRAVDRRKSVEQYFGDDRRSRDRRQYLQTKATTGDKDAGYRLRSRSETLYPTAFIPVSKEFYNELSQEQQDQLMKLQAIAQEKAGFEKGAPKFFIRDFDPGGGPEGSYSDIAADPVTDAAPRLVAGGALIGAGLLATGLVLGQLLPGGVVLVAGLLGCGIGVTLIISDRG